MELEAQDEIGTLEDIENKLLIDSSKLPSDYLHVKRDNSLTFYKIDNLDPIPDWDGVQALPAGRDPKIVASIIVFKDLSWAAFLNGTNVAKTRFNTVNRAEIRPGPLKKFSVLIALLSELLGMPEKPPEEEQLSHGSGKQKSGGEKAKAVDHMEAALASLKQFLGEMEEPNEHYTKVQFCIEQLVVSPFLLNLVLYLCSGSHVNNNKLLILAGGKEAVWPPIQYVHSNVVELSVRGARFSQIQGDLRLWTALIASCCYTTSSVYKN